MIPAPFLFDDMTPDEEPLFVHPPIVYSSEAERITIAIMGSLDCIISDEISDKRYDMAQQRVYEIIKKEVFHEDNEDVDYTINS